MVPAMPQLSPNQPLEQSTGTLLVENRLAAGRHRFSLVVVDDRGRTSEAALVVVVVQAITDPRDPVIGPLSPVVVPVRPTRSPRRAASRKKGAPP